MNAAIPAADPSRELDREDALLLTCVRATLDPSVGRPDPKDVRWPELARRARWHRLNAVIQPVVRRWFETDVPADVAAEWRDALRRQGLHALAMARALGEIDAALRAADVRYLVLKGLPLSQAVYGTLTARPSRDIDILVAPKTFETARRALEEIGFASDLGLDPAQEAICLRFAADLPMRRPDGLLVELHDSLDFQPPRAGAACARSLLAAAEPVAVANIEVPAVVGATALPYLAWHGANHAWSRLFWLLDVATITAAADDRELRAVWDSAGEVGARRPLALAWRLCAELLDVPVPQPARDAASAAAVARLAARARRMALGPVGREPVGSIERRTRGLGWSLALAPGPRARTGLLFRYLVDVRPEEIRALPLPRWLHWSYPVLRPLRVALRLAGALGRKAWPRRAPPE